MTPPREQLELDDSLNIQREPAEWLRQLLARQPNVASAGLISCGAGGYGVEVTTECGAEFMATMVRTRWG